MCAINPIHKKRIIFDFYTVEKELTKEFFDNYVLEWCLKQEQNMNQYSRIRCHVKETEQEAE